MLFVFQACSGGGGESTCTSVQLKIQISQLFQRLKKEKRTCVGENTGNTMRK